MAAALGAFAVALWWPALSTPFWGDDYVFLQSAFASRLSGEPWWTPFWPQVRYQFWRPLGHETYWRFVEAVLDGDPWRAHALNFSLWAIGCACVGMLAAQVGSAMRWERAGLGGALTAAVYAAWAVHFTPMHWTSSGDSLLILLWSALALCAWVRSPSCGRWARAAMCIALPLLQALALFSKESAVLLPPLMLCLTAFTWDRMRPGRQEIAAWATCCALVVVWLVLRPRYVSQAPAEYALLVGANVPRNIASLAAWTLNVPREALRMAFTGRPASGVAWALAALLPMALFAWLAGTQLVGRMSKRQACGAAAFFVIAYAPYFFLAWQSYEYYAQVAMIAPAILLARGAMLSPRPALALCMLALSSAIAVEGSRAIGYPGLIGRARWAEEQLVALAADQDATGAAEARVSALRVQVANEHEFYAIGRAGLAWRLGIPEGELAIQEGCQSAMDELLVFTSGPARFGECEAIEGEDS
jgi:hypothetical protein